MFQKSYFCSYLFLIFAPRAVLPQLVFKHIEIGVSMYYHYIFNLIQTSNVFNSLHQLMYPQISARKPLDDLCNAISQDQDLDTIKDLVEKSGVDVNNEDSSGWTPLRRAVRHNRPDVADYLLQHAGARLPDACTAIICNSDLHVIKSLVKAGKIFVEVKYLGGGRRPETGLTPLICAARERRIDVMDYLLQEAGASVAEKRWGDVTALIMASRGVSSEVCEMLLRHGGLSIIDDPSYKGLTPLMFAVLRSHRRVPGSRSAIVETLLASHASMSVKSLHGHTALDLAEGLRLDDIVSVLKQEEVRRRGELLMEDVGFSMLTLMPRFFISRQRRDRVAAGC